MSDILTPIVHPRQQYNYLTRMVWENKDRKAAFTISRTERTDIHQFYWYTLDHGSTDKVQRLFYCIPDGIFIDFDGVLYRIAEMGYYLPSPDIMILLNLQELENPAMYCSYIGTPVNAVKKVQQPAQAPRTSYPDSSIYYRNRSR